MAKQKVLIVGSGNTGLAIAKLLTMQQTGVILLAKKNKPEKEDVPQIIPPIFFPEKKLL